MKKLNLFFTILFITLIFSCSSDDNNATELSITELLVQNSPWTFNHYKLINIIDSGNSDFTQADIENDINQNVGGNVLTFDEDGSGSSFLPEEGTDTWQWEIINSNQLKITYDGGNGESDTFENISVSTSQFTVESESVSFDEVALFEVLHYGKFFYE
jgi:hypothetical protein